MTIHINSPRGYYVGQVRRHGARKWVTVAKRCKSGEAAMSRAALHMVGMARARVIFLADWYDPVVVMECKR